MNILLDSVILIDHLNGVGAATRYLESLEGASVSVISRAEVLAGLTATVVPAVMEWLDRYPTLAIDRRTADLAADFRRRYKWKLPDALQAAFAEQHGLKLATRNTRDFPPRRYSFVAVPYSVR